MPWTQWHFAGLPKGAWKATLLSVLVAAVGASCLTATTIDTRAYTEVPCATNAPVSIIVGANLEDLAQRMAQGVVSSTQSGCASPTPSEAYVGDLVLLPRQTSEQIAFAVMTRADGQPSDQCGAPGQAAGCIIAKRQVGFVSHRELDVRVDLRLSCLGVTCPVDATCVAGQCVTAIVPTSCPPPCGETSLPSADAGAPIRADDGGIPDAAQSETKDGGAPAPEGGPSDAGTTEGGLIAQSCLPGGAGMTNCGNGLESCCASPTVTGGMYSRGYMNDGGGAGPLFDPATVSSFRLDTYAVTVGRFRQFVKAWNNGAGYLPPAGSGKHAHLNGGNGLLSLGTDAGVVYETGWLASDDGNVAPTSANLACMTAYQTWTNTPAGNENLPINCVNWYESYAFCIWDGGFLPSESEWEYAAVGGAMEREYPWGSATPGTACPGTGCDYAIYGCYYPSGTGTCDGLTSIAPVGTPTLGAGEWGQLDFVGSVEQWVLDWGGGYVSPCPNCVYVPDAMGAPSRILRGASFYDSTLPDLEPQSRTLSLAATRSLEDGVRCARAP